MYPEFFVSGFAEAGRHMGVVIMENNKERDEILFEQLKRAKRRKRRKVIFTVLTLLILAGAGIFTAVNVLRARVRAQFAASTVEVLSYQAQKGRISTTVSGSGSLSYMDHEEITVPDGVEIAELLVSTGDSVTKGMTVATVDQNSVLSVLAETQSTLDSLAKQIDSAKNDRTSTYVSSTVSGRIKAVFVENGDSVLDVMAEHGALVLISLDGCMTVTVDADLKAGTAVQVVSNEKTYTGTVESSTAGRSVVVLTDDGPQYGAEAAVLSADGDTLGAGTLAIRNPLSITGYAGTVGWINVRENQPVYNGATLFTVNHTEYTSNYETLLRQRGEAEETMKELIALLQSGGVQSPLDGIVTQAGSDGAASAVSAYLGTASSSGSGLVTVAPDQKLSISVSVDETDILSLELGQTAEVKVSSIGDDVFRGEVTEISRIGTSASGVTQYSAIVTLNKDARMLSGMTATVDIQIQGVDDVVLIPADALRQTRATSYVFTEYNEELKEYGGMVEVVTGSSNSRFVEIVSGLKPGDTVYYTEKSANTNIFSMMPNMGGNFGSSFGGASGGNNRNTGNNRNNGSNFTGSNFGGANFGGGSFGGTSSGTRGGNR